MQDRRKTRETVFHDAFNFKNMCNQIISHELLLSSTNDSALRRFTKQEIMEHLTIFAVL